MSSLTVIKFYCDDEIKRVPMNRSLGELTYDELCVIVQRIWKSKLSTDINNLILKYVDDEGDQICLESDNDVNHALSFSSCLKVHVYDKETIPVNSKSLIPNMCLEEKTLESIKSVVKNSRDTLNKIIEQLDNIKIETPVSAKAEKEIKPLSNAELSEFLGEQNDATKTNIEDNASTPVVDQTSSSAPISTDNSTTANAPAQTLDQTTHQGSLVQTPNSIHPSQPPATSTYGQIPNTPQLSQPSNTSTMNTQSYASPTTAYQQTQSTSQITNTVGASSTQPPYQKTNSYSSNITSQPVSQSSTNSTNMYASAPPPTYGSNYPTTTTTSQYGSTNTTSHYGTTTNTSQYSSANTATSAPPQTPSSQYPPPPSSTTSSSAPYPPTSSTTTASNPSSYQRYQQTSSYGSTTMPGTSVPPPPQSSTYSSQSMQKPYGGYGSTPYGQTTSTPYGNNPYSAYNNNQNQNPYSRPNNGYGQNPNPYY